MGADCGDKRRDRLAVGSARKDTGAVNDAPGGDLLDRDLKGLRPGISRGVADGERVGGASCRRDANAAGIRRPDWFWLRFESHRFSIRHSITELRAFSLVDGPGTRIETLDGKLLAAESFQSDAVVFQLLSGLFLARAAFNCQVLLPAGKQSPNRKEENDTQEHRRINQGVLDGRFSFRGTLRPRASVSMLASPNDRRD